MDLMGGRQAAECAHRTRVDLSLGEHLSQLRDGQGCLAASAEDLAQARRSRNEVRVFRNHAL